MARGGACDIVWKPYFFSRQIGGRRGRHAARVHENDLEVREPEAARGSFPETIEARGTASGDQISWFSLRETEEHACVVSFFRQRLDLHRSVR